MVDLSLSKRFALIALNGEVYNHYSLSRKHKMKCILVSILFDFYLKGTLRKTNGYYVFDKPNEEMRPYEDYVFQIIHKESKKTFAQWINFMCKISKKVSTKLEACIITELKQDSLIMEVSDLIECDLYYRTAGITVMKYRSLPQQYEYELEALRAEVLEEGEVSDESILLIWLLEQCHKLNETFARQEIENLQKSKNDLYIKNSLAKKVYPLQIKAPISRGWIWFLATKKKVLRSKVGIGMTFMFPELQRDQSIFIDSEQWFAPKGDRLTQTVALLETKGHICKIKSYGEVPLVEIDNFLYELIPDGVVSGRIPIYGVRLRRYQM